MGRPLQSVSRSTLGGKIRLARLAKELSTPELGRRVGISHQSIVRTELGQTEPDRTTLIRLAQELKDDFGLPWLKRYAVDAPREIPIEGRVAAGEPIIAIEEGETVTIDERLIRATGDVVALRVSGNSMVADHILDGDVLICRRTPEPRKDSIVVVDFKGEVGASIKRWRRKGDTVILSSDHHSKEMPKYEYPTWRLGKVFEVIGLIRRMK